MGQRRHTANTINYIQRSYVISEELVQYILTTNVVKQFKMWESKGKFTNDYSGIKWTRILKTYNTHSEYGT